VFQPQHLGQSVFRAVMALVLATPAAAQTAPELPRAWVNTAPVSVTGRTISVSAGGSVQAAIDQAVGGDVIVLQAGATFTGPVRLRNKAGSGWITIRTSAADSQLPEPGQRITPAYAPALPKLVTTGAWAAVETDPGAHHYRFIGVEFAVAPGVATNYGIVTVGQGNETQVSQLPHNIVFDRVYVHGQATGNVRRGIALNSAWSAVIDSYISNIHEVGADSQAIGLWNGTGPFKIVNNYLEAAGENILIGGADPTIPNLVPSDIEVRRNVMYKPLSWRSGDPSYAGIAWTVKNIFELKNAQRVLVEGNLLQHNWLASQNGFSILFTVRNQQGTAPWSVVQDVTFVSNLVQSVAAGVNILGWDDTYSSQQTRRIRVANNLFVDVNGARWGGSGRLIQVLDGAADVAIEHNTVLQSGEFIVGSGRPTSGFVFRNNIVNNGGYGMGGDGTYGNPKGTLATYFPNALFTHNAVVGASASSYPAGNYFPASFDAVGFVSLSTGDYALSSSSPLKTAASDGSDVGVNFSTFFAAYSSAVPTGGGTGGGSGGGGTSGGGTTDTTAPSVTVTAPGANATVNGTVTLTASASDNVGVAGVRFLVDGVAVGGEITAAPYAAQWNSTAVSDGTHSLRAEARDAAGNVAASASVTVTVSQGKVTSGQPVAWTRLRNATASGTSLDKSAGCDGCADAGASSSQAITSGLGYVEFVVSSTARQYAVGLSVGDSDTSEADIDFGLKLWPGGAAEVRLNGKFQNAETHVASGDVLRIAVTAQNVVTFSKNGVAFHQARKKVTYPLIADVSLSTMQSRVLDARMGGVPVTAAAVTAVAWTQMANVATTGSGLAKVAGCDGCPDGGAVSAQVISSGNGHVEFKAADTFGQRLIGLSSGNAGTSEADIDFALKFWPGGGVDVRENGAYVGAESSYTTSDVFRIGVAAGVVTYYKNGTVLYRSTRVPGSSLLVDTSFTTMSTGISEVTVSGAQ
jgi:hypothetical protein